MSKLEKPNQKPQIIQKTSVKNLAGNKEIQQSLVYCALMVGLKPEKMEIEIAQKFIKTNFPNLTLEELVNAFSFNSTGKYWQIIEPFGSFNTLFIGKILNANDVYLKSKRLREIKSLPEPVKNDLISHEEAKPMLDAMAKELKKIDMKFRLNNKKVK